jgi:hypothetical protein
LTTDLGNAIRNRVRDWGARGAARAVFAGGRNGLSAPPRRTRGCQHAAGVCGAGDRPRRKVRDATAFVEVLRGFPRVRSIHWAVNDTAGGGDERPVEAPVGRGCDRRGGARPALRVRPNAFLQTNTRMAERLYSMAIEYAGLTAARRFTTSTADRHDRAVDGGARADGVGSRRRGGIVACALEIADLNGSPTQPSSRVTSVRCSTELRERAGEPDVVVVDPPRAGLAGKALKRVGNGRAAARLRLVQPDDARRRRRSGCARSTATSSCARGRSTCSRTRRTSRQSRCWSGARERTDGKYVIRRSAERYLRALA